MCIRDRNQQAIEMTQIYRDIIKGTRELLSAVIDNRLNTAMKYLASITIVMAVSYTHLDVYKRQGFGGRLFP